MKKRPKLSFSHFLYVPFTGLGLFAGYRGDGWLKDRIKLFKRFVLPSIMNQSKLGQFYLWCSWRPEEEHNPIVKDFIAGLKLIRDFSVIHTFSGVCFWDDKYTDEVASSRLSSSLEGALPVLMPAVGDASHVIMTIQPSDDCYEGRMVERVQEKLWDMLIEDPKISNLATGYRYGYIMDYGTKELAEYISDDWKTDSTSTYTTNTIPPFFSLLFTKEEFLDPRKHYDHTGPYKSHEYIAEVFDYQPFEERGFLVGTHGANISTTFNHRYAGRRITGEEKDKLLLHFGLFAAEPLQISKRPHLYIRMILNRLPRSWRHAILKWYFSRSWTKQSK